MIHEYDSHVLLAACDRTETTEGNAVGGLFTSALIAALEEGDNITYSQLQQRINRQYQILWKTACDQIDSFLKKTPQFAKSFHGPRYPTVQSPQCVGPLTHRSRLVWKAVGDMNQSFNVDMAETTPTETRQCKINAGENMGVQQGAIFEIYTATREEREARTYTVTASMAEPAWCFCDLQTDVDIEPDNVHAVIVSKPINPLKYFVEFTESDRGIFESQG
jgi:hypothetical protein